MSFDKHTVDLICPQCGYKLGEQRLFQEYEQKVAIWLDGEICASFNEAFDVWRCATFPELTFQVKYSHVNHRKGAAKKKDRYPVWIWTQNKMHADSQPDYFVLIGVQDNRKENYFLLSLKQWLKLSSSMNNGKGGRILQVTPHQFSRRGQSPKCPSGYVHENKGWKYEVKNPEQNLIERVRTLESYHQFELSI